MLWIKIKQDEQDRESGEQEHYLLCEQRPERDEGTKRLYERGAFQQRNLPEQRPCGRRGNSSKADWLGHGGER